MHVDDIKVMHQHVISASGKERLFIEVTLQIVLVFLCEILHIHVQQDIDHLVERKICIKPRLLCKVCRPVFKELHPFAELSG